MHDPRGSVPIVVRAVADLAKHIEAPAIQSLIRRETAREFIPGSDLRERVATRDEGRTEMGSVPAVAHCTVGVLAPAIPGAGRRHAAGVRPSRCDLGERQTAADRRGNDTKRRGVVAHGTVTTPTPAIGGACGGNGARMELTRADQDELQVGMRRRRRGAGSSGAVAELPVEVVPPTVGDAIGADATRVAIAAADLYEQHAPRRDPRWREPLQTNAVAKLSMLVETPTIRNMRRTDTARVERAGTDLVEDHAPSDGDGDGRFVRGSVAQLALSVLAPTESVFSRGDAA